MGDSKARPTDTAVFGSDDERRQYDRRAGADRRGSLRWDPRAKDKERRSGYDRRQEANGDYVRQ